MGFWCEWDLKEPLIKQMYDVDVVRADIDNAVYPGLLLADSYFLHGLKSNWKLSQLAPVSPVYLQGGVVCPLFPRPSPRPLLAPVCKVWRRCLAPPPIFKSRRLYANTRVPARATRNRRSSTTESAHFCTLGTKCDLKINGTRFHSSAALHETVGDNEIQNG